MKILDLLKRSLKKTLKHDCESCGMCSNDSVHVKWVTKESDKDRDDDAEDASADEGENN
ncbi:hypothetical protein [Methanobacterium aggregans]|uniref:hypothetical protein n=1 Tax=Methanobacterium aggregans TaxID=1615586 RepID=UPI001AE7E0F1|nr:hypothetical protein [Methanobacterium aggregans]MBP2046676.1 hypothetical protein [Methanobacterium aggregans]